MNAASAPGGATSDRGAPSEAESEADQGPPSAPRLREMSEDDVAAEQRDVDEEEPQLKTPPPESGKQHVTPGPTATVSEPDEDISITVTMEESEAPPPISPSPPEVAAPLGIGARSPIPDLSGPQPRLALVSEPEIELHGMTPLSAIAETLESLSVKSVSGPVAPAIPPAPPEPMARSGQGASFRPQDIELAVPVPLSDLSIPSATPSGVRPVPPPSLAPAATPPTSAAPFARTTPSVPDAMPSMSAASSEPASAPPVRLMASPLPDDAGKPAPPVEVWASTFTPAALRGQVASFVGHNANFEPKTFGELVRASLALGEDKS
jgi:hypothetical protein